MAEDGDEFEGIDINGPWGGVRIGSVLLEEMTIAGE